MTYLLVITILLSVCHLSSAVTRIHSVYWNTTNPIFRIDNSQHIVDVNEGNEPWEYDQLNIICPHNSLEKHVIYSVSEEEYNSCRVINPKPKIVAVCDKPKSFIYVTITFRSFSPTPGSLEFKPGQNYYFISTSTQRDIHRRVGGFCSSHNMKMIFKVADNNVQEQATDNNNLLQINLNQPRQVSPSLRDQPQYPRVWNSRVPAFRNDYIYYYKPWGSRLSSQQQRYSRQSRVQQSEIVSQALPFTSSSNTLISGVSILIGLFTITSLIN